MSKIDIEKNLLGAYADNPDLFIKCQHLVSSNLFTQTTTKFAYKIIKGCHTKGIKPDITILFNEAKKAGLTQVQCAEIATFFNYDYRYSSQPEVYVAILFSDYVARFLMPIFQDAHNRLLHEDDSLEVISLVKNAITEVELVINNVAKDKSIECIVDEAIAEIKAAKEDKNEIGYTTGVKSIDNLIGGITPGVLMIGARPSMGKTSFIVNIIRINAIEKAVPVVMFSLEMKASQIVKNIMANMYEINTFAMKTGQISDEEMAFVENTKIKLKTNLIIDDRPAINWQYIDAKLRHIRKTVPIEKKIIVMIDYIQLMSNDEEEIKGKTDEAALDTTATKLQSLWKIHNACIIELSQLSRRVEERNPPRPKMSDMKGSGGLEANADTVILMYRPDYYIDNPVEEKTGQSLKGAVEFIVHKNRHGKKGSAFGRFHNQYSKFSDWKEEESGIITGSDEAF